MRLPPPAPPPPRRRAAATWLERLLLAAIAVRLGQGLVRAVRPPDDPTPPPPLRVDLSADPPSRLVFLPGIGPTRARAIVEDRLQHGPVATPEDLDRVPGIGPGTVRRIRETPRVAADPGADAEGPEDDPDG